MAATNDVFSKQKLIFFVAQDIDDVARREVPNLIERLSNALGWSINPPRLIDEHDSSDIGPNDEAIDTLGGELEIYSAIENRDLPRELDVQNFYEVAAVVAAVQRVSKEFDLSFDFELGGSFVGSIESGETDKLLELGLIEPWRSHLFG